MDQAEMILDLDSFRKWWIYFLTCGAFEQMEVNKNNGMFVVPSAELYAAFSKYCLDRKWRPCHNTSFGKYLKIVCGDLGYKISARIEPSGPKKLILFWPLEHYRKVMSLHLGVKIDWKNPLVHGAAAEMQAYIKGERLLDGKNRLAFKPMVRQKS